MSKNLNLFIPITKVDEPKRLVYGIATAEQPDSSGEICDYITTVPYYKEWSGNIEKTTDGKSKGNLRAMHDNIAAGKITQINFNDSDKQIEICAKVVDDAEWKKVIEGVYTGFSQGGSYVKTWKDGEYTRYTARPSEVSLVDLPCLPTATFELLRTGGATEMRKFQTKEDPMSEKEKAIQVWQAADGSTHATKAEALKKTAEFDKHPIDDVTQNTITEIDNLLNKAEGKEHAEATKAEEDSTGHVKKAADETPAGDKQTTISSNPTKIKIKKGLFEVSRLADLIQELAWLQGCCENEAMWEMDGSKVPASLMESIKGLGSALKAMVEEEVTELLGADGAEMAMSAKIEALCKRGAKISAASKAHIDSMHKSAQDHMDHMSKCYKALGMEMGGEDEAEKMAKIATEKAEAEKQELLKAKEAAEEKNLLLEKKIQTQDEALAKVAERLKALELQPLPSKGVLYDISKGHEHRPDSGSVAVETKTTPKRANRAVSPEADRRRLGF